MASCCWPPVLSDHPQTAIDLYVIDSRIIELNLIESSKISRMFVVVVVVYSLHEKMAVF